VIVEPHRGQAGAVIRSPTCWLGAFRRRTRRGQ
jgi:hypothetical protein